MFSLLDPRLTAGYAQMTAPQFGGPNMLTASALPQPMTPGVDPRIGAANMNMLIAPGGTLPPTPSQNVSVPAVPPPMPSPAPQQAQESRPALSGGSGTDNPSKPQAGSFWDSERGQMLQDMFLGLAMGKDANSSLAYAAAMAAQGRNSRRDKAKTEAQSNQTVQFLMGKGMDEQTATMVARDPQSLTAFLKGKVSPDGAPTEYGLQPIYATDGNGNTVAYQLSKNGTIKAIDLPDGFHPSGNLAQIDTGTGVQMYDTRTHQQIGQVAKDIAGTKVQEAAGTAQGAALVNLPSAIASADQTLSVIDDLSKNDKLYHGMSSMLNNIPGTEGYAANAKLKQLQGMTFLQAYAGLKGAGAITEVEGKKAEQAIGRLDASMSADEFKAALADLADVVKRGKERAITMAGGGVKAPETPQVAPLQSGAVEGGYRFKGGDPANPANWEKVQ